MNSSLHHAVISLKKLQRLHLRGWDLRLDQDSNVNDPQPMKEIIHYSVLEDVRRLAKTIRQSGPVLEVLVLYPYKGIVIDINPEVLSPTLLFGGHEEAPVQPPFYDPHLSALTHFDLSMSLTPPSLLYLSNILPRLDLVHFGCNKDSHGLLRYCNLASLKSLSRNQTSGTDLELLLDTMGDGSATPTWDGLEQFYIQGMDYNTKVPTRFLQSAQLNPLYLDCVDSTPLTWILEAINLYKLQEISICNSWFYLTTERAIANRFSEFTEALVVRVNEVSSTRYFEYGRASRTDTGSLEALPHHRIINQGKMSSVDHHYSFLQFVLPVYSY